jgi:thiol:disulfide interchange protein
MVGLEAGVHVFFALVSMLVAAVGLGMLFQKKPDVPKLKLLTITLAVLVWLSWFTVAPVYVNEYGVDKAAIKAYPETVAAHAIGMETKEHLFYTGLLLATLAPIIVYSIDISENEAGKKILIVVLVLLIIGGVSLDALGAWISTAAKIAWSLGGA